MFCTCHMTPHEYLILMSYGLNVRINISVNQCRLHLRQNVTGVAVSIASYRWAIRVRKIKGTVSELHPPLGPDGGQRTSLRLCTPKDRPQRTPRHLPHHLAVGSAAVACQDPSITAEETGPGDAVQQVSTRDADVTTVHLQLALPFVTRTSPRLQIPVPNGAGLLVRPQALLPGLFSYSSLL